MVPMKWRCNQGDPSGVKSSFSLCSRNVSRNSFSAQLRASCQPARCPKPPLGGNAFLGGWLVLSFTDFLAVAEVSLWVGKIGSCTNNFSVVPDELFSSEVMVPSTQIAIYSFCKRDKSLNHFFLVLPRLFYKFFQKDRSSPLFHDEEVSVLF